MKHRTPLRYPRTAAEAFGGPEYANAIEGPERTPYPRALWITLIGCFAAAVLAARLT